MYANVISAILIGLAFGTIALTGCESSQPALAPAPRSTPSRIAVEAPPEPTKTSDLGAASTPSSQNLLYDDKAAPFTIQYPSGWRIREEPENISFQAPDDTAMLQIIMYEYLEGASKNITAKDILNNFAQNFTLGRGLKLSEQVTNADASVTANVEFVDASARARQGLVRILLAKTRRFHFIVLFSSNRDQFPRYKPIGTTVVDSFRER